MESSSLQNGNGRGRSYKEEERVVPTSPSSPPSAPNRVARAPKCPRSVSLRENRRKRANLPHQQKLAPGRRVSPLGASEQIMAKTTSYRPAVSRSRQAVSNSGAWLALCWRSIPPGAGFVSPGASCWHFPPCYSGLLISLDFWNKASHLQKGHKNGD